MTDDGISKTTNQSKKIFINPKYTNHAVENVNRNIHINPKFANIHVNPSFSNIHVNPLFKGAHVNPNFNKPIAPNIKVHINPKHFDALFSNEIKNVSDINAKVSIAPVQKPIVLNTKVQNIAPKIGGTENSASKYSFLSNRKLVKNTCNKLIKDVKKVEIQPMTLISKSKTKLIRAPLQNVNSNKILNTNPFKLRLNKKSPKKNPVVLLKTSPFKPTLCSMRRKTTKYKLDRRLEKPETSVILSKTKYAIRHLNRSSEKSLDVNKVTKYRKVYQMPSGKLFNCIINRTTVKRFTKLNRYSKTNVNGDHEENHSVIKNRSAYKVINSKSRKSSTSIIKREALRITNIPCQVFRKYGVCKRSEQGRCFKVHDKRQIDICKDYLAGKCSKSNCLLSHDTSAAKMPICLHYLAGVCGRDNCIYPHIKHNANVSVCKIFLRGYCEKAEKCKYRHVFLCPDFAKTNKCPRSKCPYPHAARKNTSKARLYKKQVNKRESVKTDDKIKEEKDLTNRYYDNSDTNTVKDILEHGNTLSDNSDVSINDNDEVHTNKRPALGILPSYIPL